jgi:hypothetical protein
VWVLLLEFRGNRIARSKLLGQIAHGKEEVEIFEKVKKISQIS